MANFLLQPGETADQPSRLQESLGAARGKPLADGVCRTLVAVSKSSTSPERRKLLAEAVEQELGAAPTVFAHAESDVTIVCESAGLPIAEVAVRLIDERADFVEYAKRVFSRGDVPFEPLTLKEEAE